MLFNLLGSIVVLAATIKIVTSKNSQGFISAFGKAFSGAINAELGNG